MTRKIHKRSKVSRTESTNEPRQPSRLEKKRNTHAGCPTGHRPTRDVSGVSGSTTPFHMLAQARGLSAAYQPGCHRQPGVLGTGGYADPELPPLARRSTIMAVRP